MGGLFGKPSTLNVSEVNKIINESIIKLSNNVSNTNNVTQYIEASGNSEISGNTQYADVKSNISSIVSATQDSNFNTKFNNDVIQNLQQKSVALLGVFDSLLQNKNIDLNASIENKLNNLNLTETAQICATNNNITQSIIAKDNAKITNNSQTVKSEFLTSCSTSSKNNMSAISNITNSINQKAVSVSENPLNFISDIFKNFSMIILLIIVVIVAGFVIMIGPGKLDANSIIKEGVQVAKLL